MVVNTYLLDFSVEPNSLETLERRKLIMDNVEGCLKEYINDLRRESFMDLDGGFLAVLLGPCGSFVTVRGVRQGLVTINIEHYKEDSEEDMLTLEQLRLFELAIGEALASSRSKHFPPVKRGGAIDVYLTTSGSMLHLVPVPQMRVRSLDSLLRCRLHVKKSHKYPPFKRGLERYFLSTDDRLLEYDIDKVVFEETSPYQKVQIVHSKTLGNLLLLDDLQNMSESDLIYTETLMQRGIENYEDKEIIILGGGDGCLLWELLKEKPKFVTMLELDEVVMKACSIHLRSVCGDCLDNYKGERYEIIVGDCFKTLEKFIKEGKKVDYVFGDLTDIPVDSSGLHQETWDFVRLILNKSLKILRPGGKILTHANGVSAVKGLQLYESVLKSLEVPVNFTRAKAYVPSFLEEWVFYQLTPCLNYNHVSS